MRHLLLFFNELSAPPNDLAEDALQQWRAWAITLFGCLRSAARHNSRLNIGIAPGRWHALCGAKPLAVLMKDWLGRTEYQWLLAKLRLTDNEELAVDVLVQEQRAVGLANALVAGTWSISFPVEPSSWRTPIVLASKHHLDGDALIETQCEIRHLSIDEHAEYWRIELEEWGYDIAENNVLFRYGRFVVSMYPNDHMPPHIHLVAPPEGNQSWRTVAKYRVDSFERIEGPSNWDSLFRGWVGVNQQDLLVCWDRCRRGLHPYRVGNG